MLALPAVATTGRADGGPRPESRNGAPAVDFAVRVAAADPAGLALATQALRKVLAAERAHARRLDGEHSDGLIATLPLGGGGTTDIPGRPADQALPPEVVEGLELPIGAAGLMLGSNRHRSSGGGRLLPARTDPGLLVGGVRAPALALRAMALGARVVVQTARPQAWEPFVRGAAVPGESIAVVTARPPIEMPPGSALHPLLVVVDVGPVGADTRPGAGWQATLVVRDDFSAADVDVASRADLLACSRCGRGGEPGRRRARPRRRAQWLTRIRADMLAWSIAARCAGPRSPRRPIEAQLIGAAVPRIAIEIRKIAECCSRVARPWHDPVPWASSSGL
jgi:hypothetical protein